MPHRAPDDLFAYVHSLELETLGWPAPLRRRRFMEASLALAAGGILAATRAGNASAQTGGARFSGYPFTLGVASGAPRHDSVVLWTRLIPEPLNGSGDGGIPADRISVSWEVAEDEQFKKIVRRGAHRAIPELAYSVHAEVQGLEPGQWYFYRFLAGNEVSPVGRTRTAGVKEEKLRFAFASCQSYEQGFFTAYRHMLKENVDLVAFLGDYIYESNWGGNLVRRHAGPEPETLNQYRLRHAQYKTDPDLKAMHAAAPWIVTWDDHEVDNDYADDQSEHLDPRFLTRRAAAYQAYYEHMPLALSALPRGPNMRLYDRFSFGTLPSSMCSTTASTAPTRPVRVQAWAAATRSRTAASACHPGAPCWGRRRSSGWRTAWRSRARSGMCSLSKPWCHSGIRNPARSRSGPMAGTAIRSRESACSTIWSSARSPIRCSSAAMCTATM